MDTKAELRLRKRLQTRRWRRKNRRKLKAIYFASDLRKRGLTVEQFRAMVKAQKGKCAVCEGRKALRGNRLAIDHDHKTGRVRALLCGRCNLILGLAEDRKKLLSSLVRYLRRF